MKTTMSVEMMAKQLTQLVKLGYGKCELYQGVDDGGNGITKTLSSPVVWGTNHKNRAYHKGEVGPEDEKKTIVVMG